MPESSRSDSFQSEAALEKEFIRLLTIQGYEYITIHDENGLIANLRQQLTLLNDYTFTDSEWKRFFMETLANANEGIVENSRTIQTDHVKVLRPGTATAQLTSRPQQDANYTKGHTPASFLIYWQVICMT